MISPTFTDPAVQARWDAYHGKVEQLVARAGPDVAGLDTELRDHLAQSYASDPDGSEHERLERAIARLGDPADYLRPLLADALLERGSQTFNPVTIGRGLYHAVLSGSRRIAKAAAFALGYTALGVLAAMSLLKPFFADSIGLVRGEDGSLTFGIASSGGEELLGLWSIPLTLALCAALYVLLTRGLRRQR